MAADLHQSSHTAYTAAEIPSDERVERGDESGAIGRLALLIAALVIVILLLLLITQRVPSVVGLDRADAEARLKTAGLVLGDVSESLSSTRKTGMVDEQFPESGVMLRTGGRVDIVVAKSTELLTVPNALGGDYASAAVQIQQAGFEAQPAEEYSDTIPLGDPISQYPIAGSKAPRGSAVTVSYSRGPVSAVETSFTPSDTDGALTDVNGSTGTSNGDTPVINTTRAFPGATAWSTGGDIFVRLTPGGGARRVTSGQDWDTNPVVAPSGCYLVFMRAPAQGGRATSIGAVSFTTFATHLLTKPEVNVTSRPERWVGAPVFAPKPGSTQPDSDVIVYPHYFPMDIPGSDAGDVSAHLLVCQVPIDSTWVSWNTAQFRPAGTLELSASGRAGCVRVRQFGGDELRYDRDFLLETGIYLRR